MKNLLFWAFQSSVDIIDTFLDKRLLYAGAWLKKMCCQWRCEGLLMDASEAAQEFIAAIPCTWGSQFLGFHGNQVKPFSPVSACNT